jgi:DNA-binding CsgD family transcriptional regulator/PAS domain-containing protein
MAKLAATFYACFKFWFHARKEIFLESSDCMNRFDELKNVYQTQEGYLATSSAKIQKLNFDYLLAQFFCPSPFFYYILDSPTLTFDYCSESMSKMLGQQFDGESLNAFIEKMHPDDFEFVLKCEDYVANFLNNEVSHDKIIKYKISYCVRLKGKEGKYRLFLIQNIAIQTAEDGALLKVMGIHSDISHITETNNYKLSLTGLDDEPSFLGIDLDVTQNIEVKASANPFSKRELQIIKLLGEGLTASHIADKLHISEETVKTHKKNALKKSSSQNATSLVAYCIRQGLI